MKANTGKYILLSMAFVSIFVCLLPLYETLLLARQLRAMAPHILFDTGTYYLFFASLLITVTVVNFFGEKNKQSFAACHAASLLIANFIVVVLLAPFGAQAVVWKLKADGYAQCDDPSELSRVSRGQSYIFSLDGCDSLEIKGAP